MAPMFGLFGGNEPAAPQKHEITTKEYAKEYLLSLAADYSGNYATRGTDPDRRMAENLRVLANDTAFLDAFMKKGGKLVVEPAANGKAQVDLKPLVDFAASYGNAGDRVNEAGKSLQTELAKTLEASFAGRADARKAYGEHWKVGGPAVDEKKANDSWAGTLMNFAPLAILAVTGLSIEGILLAGIGILIMNLGGFGNMAAEAMGFKSSAHGKKVEAADYTRGVIRQPGLQVVSPVEGVTYTPLTELKQTKEEKEASLLRVGTVTNKENKKFDVLAEYDPATGLMKGMKLRDESGALTTVKHKDGNAFLGYVPGTRQPLPIMRVGKDSKGETTLTPLPLHPITKHQMLQVGGEAAFGGTSFMHLATPTVTPGSPTPRVNDISSSNLVTAEKAVVKRRDDLPAESRGAFPAEIEIGTMEIGGRTLGSTPQKVKLVMTGSLSGDGKNFTAYGVIALNEKGEQVSLDGSKKLFDVIVPSGAGKTFQVKDGKIEGDASKKAFDAVVTATGNDIASKVHGGNAFKPVGATPPAPVAPVVTSGPKEHNLRQSIAPTAILGALIAPDSPQAKKRYVDVRGAFEGPGGKKYDMIVAGSVNADGKFVPTELLAVSEGNLVRGTDGKPVTYPLSGSHAYAVTGDKVKDALFDTHLAAYTDALKKKTLETLTPPAPAVAGTPVRELNDAEKAQLRSDGVSEDDIAKWRKVKLEDATIDDKPYTVYAYGTLENGNFTAHTASARYGDKSLEIGGKPVVDVLAPPAIFPVVGNAIPPADTLFAGFRNAETRKLEILGLTLTPSRPNRSLEATSDAEKAAYRSDYRVWLGDVQVDGKKPDGTTDKVTVPLYAYGNLSADGKLHISATGAVESRAGGRPVKVRNETFEMFVNVPSGYNSLTDGSPAFVVENAAAGRHGAHIVSSDFEEYRRIATKGAQFKVTGTTLVTETSRPRAALPPAPGVTTAVREAGMLPPPTPLPPTLGEAMTSALAQASAAIGRAQESAGAAASGLSVDALTRGLSTVANQLQVTDKVYNSVDKLKSGLEALSLSGNDQATDLLARLESGSPKMPADKGFALVQDDAGRLNIVTGTVAPDSPVFNAEFTLRLVGGELREADLSHMVTLSNGLLTQGRNELVDELSADTRREPEVIPPTVPRAPNQLGMPAELPDR